MVETQLERRGIRDSRVLEAMRRIPREPFIPEPKRTAAYDDEPVGIGHGQTISQPYMTALMAQLLELEGSEKVLEVGAGCGYAAAVLASLASRVVAVEIIPELAADARRNLEAMGLGDKVMVVTGDGSIGYPAMAPFDAISVAAAAPGVSETLIGQLADPGLAVIPVGTMTEQELVVIRREHGQISTRAGAGCRFVPLRGGEGWRIE